MSVPRYMWTSEVVLGFAKEKSWANFSPYRGWAYKSLANGRFFHMHLYICIAYPYEWNYTYHTYRNDIDKQWPMKNLVLMFFQVRISQFLPSASVWIILTLNFRIPLNIILIVFMSIIFVFIVPLPHAMTGMVHHLIHLPLLLTPSLYAPSDPSFPVSSHVL